MKTSTAIALIILAIVVIVGFPLAIIWALNTLFGLGIAYSFWNWLAVVVLKVFVFTAHTTSTRK